MDKTLGSDIFALLGTLAGENLTTLFLEHVAIPTTSGKVLRTATTYNQLGWQTRKVWKKLVGGREIIDVIFLQHINAPEQRIEIVEADVPGHTAFRVMDPQAFNCMVTTLASNNRFEHLEDQHVANTTTSAEMFRVIETGAVFQLVYRSPHSVFFEGDPR